MTTTRRLAAILAADVAGYSAAMERDEEGTAAAVRRLRRDVIEPKLAEHSGRLIKTTGDGFLAEFASPIAALSCALAIQQRPNTGGLQLRIGLNLGDVIIEEGGDLLGEGVNIAARLEGLAEPGGILISSKVHGEVEGKVEAVFEDRGEHQVKNISKPVRAYAVLTGAAASAKMAERSKPLPLPDKPSIAVLPFQNMSGDPEQEYFADGIVEEITTALSRFKSLFVIARNSSFTYKGKAADIKQVGRELGVRYVLEGSVRKASGRVRITGQLIEAATGVHLWADRFDGNLEDVFDLQDSITVSVVGAIAPRLVQAHLEQRISAPTANLDSYEYYMRGMMLRNRRSFAEAVPMFRKAIELDAGFGLAYAKAAWTLWAQPNVSLAPLSEKEQLEAISLAEKALQLASDDAEAIISTVWVFEQLAHDHAKAHLLVERAVDLNPNLSQVWNVRAWMSVLMGEHVRAQEQFARALRLNPLDPVMVPNILWGNATVSGFLGRHQEAIVWAEKMLIYRPKDFFGLLILARSADCLGQQDKAKQIAREICSLYPNMMQGHFAHSLMNSLRRPEDREMQRRTIELLGLDE